MSNFNYEVFAAAKQFIESNPEKANSEISAQTEIGDRYNVKAKVRNFEFLLDEEKPIGGYDLGPNPLEYILASLGACQTVVYKIIAAEKNIQLENVKIHLKGVIDLRGFLELDDQVKPGFQSLEYETLIVSDEDPSVIRELVEEVEKRCPVLDTIVSTTPVQVRLRQSVLQ